MIDQLSHVEAELDGILGRVVPETLQALDAEQIYQQASRIEAKAGSLRVLCAGRAAESGTWREKGFRSAAHYLASQTRAPLREAAEALATSGRLDWLPDVEDALRSGQLTPARTKVIAEAAEDHPASQRELVDSARAKEFSELEDDCRRIRVLAASKRDEAERERRIWARRHFWHRTGPDGAFRFGGETTAANGARMVAAVMARAQEIFDRARSEGERQASGAYALDALVELVAEDRSGTHQARGKDATVSVLVSDESLRRGWRDGDEICEIAGLGPVSVAAVEQIVGDARLELVVGRGADVQSLCSLGRTVPRAIRSALEKRDPTCVVPNCTVRRGLEIHHWRVPFAQDRRTTLDGTCRICSHHHDLVTYAGWDLVGGPGRWRLIDPEHRDDVGVDGHSSRQGTGNIAVEPLDDGFGSLGVRDSTRAESRARNKRIGPDSDREKGSDVPARLELRE